MIFAPALGILALDDRRSTRWRGAPLSHGALRLRKARVWVSVIAPTLFGGVQQLRRRIFGKLRTVVTSRVEREKKNDYNPNSGRDGDWLGPPEACVAALKFYARFAIMQSEATQKIRLERLW